jgi:hypothetical protein
MVISTLNYFKINLLNKSFVILFPFFLFLATAQAQSDQELKNAYEYGKKLLADGKYNAAKETFYKLTQPRSNNIYEKHAYYFSAFAAYYSGDNVFAKQYLQKMIEKFPSFSQIEEAKYLLGIIYLDLGEFKQGLETLNAIKQSGLLENSKVSKQIFFAKMSTEALKNLYAQFSDEIIGEVLAQKLSSQRLNAEEKILLSTLTQKYGLNTASQNTFSNVATDTPILKSAYNFGIFLPFLQKDTSPNQVNRKYQFVYDMYEGMKMAKEDLEKEGININLFAFDTERNDTTVRELVKKEWNSEIDLIVGALYPNNTKVKLAEAKKINIVNPIGNDSELLKNNPYLFLCEPTPETQGVKAAEFALSNFAGKRAFVYFGNNLQDSLIAYAYQRRLQQDPNYQVVVQKLKAKVGYYNYLSDINKVSKADSAHLFICSDEENKALNFVSAMRTARRGFPILTYPNWLDFSQLSFDQFEELRVHFLMTNQYIRSNKESVAFKKEYINRNMMFPSKFAYIGYETIYYFGKIIAKYGTNFQYAIKQKGYEKGRIMSGFNFYGSNDNLCITICKLSEGEVEVVNLPLMNEIGIDEKD